MNIFKTDVIIVLVAFLATLSAYVYTQDNALLGLTLLLGGVLGGVARGEKGDTANIDNVEKVAILPSKE